jgi:class 3 adenylate cyclase
MVIFFHMSNHATIPKVIQILHDDKGVHVVAAVNLYESIPESSLMGLAVCKELVGQEVGCAIGMAQGSTFCGVTGCFSVACRWDITGPPAVRAARLMQYALRLNLEVAIDQSVYNDNPMAFSKLTLHNTSAILKGTTSPIPVYTLSRSTTSSAFRVLETIYGKNCEVLTFCTFWTPFLLKR